MEEHHKRLKLCDTRPAYRQGRKLTAVKTYTINDESIHLLVFGVPSLDLGNELKKKFNKFGDVIVNHVPDYKEREIFTEVFHVKYSRLTSARFAKRKLDDNGFFGGVMHVCYAPEFETVDELRDKLRFRMKEVAFKLKKLSKTKNE